MTAQKTYMRGEELVGKLFSGERDFSGIILKEGFNLSRHPEFSYLQDYLRSQDLTKNPVILNGAKLRHMSASGLYLPYVEGNGIDFGYSNLRSACLENGSFEEGNFEYANMKKAALDRTNLERAILPYAVLRGATLSGSNAYLTDFSLSDMRGIKGMEAIQGLAYAIFTDAQVDPAQKEIIERVMISYLWKGRRSP